jgi:hypothetical protein
MPVITNTLVSLETGAEIEVRDIASSEELASNDGAKLVGYAYSTVQSAISRMKRYTDYNISLPSVGYSTSFWNSVWNDRLVDNDVFLPGKMNICADLHGTANNAVAMSILGNNSGSFTAQIVAGNSGTLSSYGMAEDVLTYHGISGKSSVTTSNPTYTSSTITITDSANVSKIKTGTVIKTSDNYWTHVVSITGNIITVDGWYLSGVQGTPTGTTAHLNQIDKTYLSNKVLWIPSTYTGTKAIGEEWDFYNAALSSGELNGQDMVIHSDSTYGMDTAFITRSGVAGLGWATGYSARGSSYCNFQAVTGVSGLTPSLASFYESSGATTGFLFNGSNTSYSMRWRYSTSSTVYPTAKNTFGFDICGGSVYGAAVSGTQLTLTAKTRLINNSSAFSLILPNTNLVAGQELYFIITSTSTITVTAGSLNVNQSTSFVHTPTMSFTRAYAIFDGTQWYFAR